MDDTRTVAMPVPSKVMVGVGPDTETRPPVRNLAERGNHLPRAVSFWTGDPGETADFRTGIRRTVWTRMQYRSDLRVQVVSWRRIKCGDGTYTMRSQSIDSPPAAMIVAQRSTPFT